MISQPAVQQILRHLTQQHITLATAESLTAGALAARIADVPGASAVLRGGVVSYTNQVKHDLLHVDPDLLATRGAVDGAVAAQMALGAAQACGADIGISTTGVAGPEPHQGKPVGTVYVGVAVRGGVALREELSLPEDVSVYATDQGLAGSRLLELNGDRSAIRAASVDAALELLGGILGGLSGISQRSSLE